ncbi:MAG: lipoyl(octanoyl) transferase LipB [Cyanosarcina radialis HA8281-LM2]|jgi:lipoyl(octanoyl) transferase|nr:lipoyl(octanoyl) transferase LipB [Cyanosarcina radialis HA8281-LM2]
MQMTYQCWLYDRPQMPYAEALEWQRSLVRSRLQDPQLDDVLILLEHPPVYTLGQGASLDFLKFAPGEIKGEMGRWGDGEMGRWGDGERRELNTQHSLAEVYRVERGGEVTYHCLGQLVGYPILNLRRYQTDLHWYLRQLEEVLIRVLAIYGLQGERVPGLTGVWLEGGKVAAIGIKVSRWITMHGFALNVCPDLSGFQQIVPCGIVDKPVASLAQFVPEIDLAVVRQQVAAAFAEVFNVRLIAPVLSIEAIA